MLDVLQDSGSRAASDPRPGISGQPPETLAAWFTERGQPAYRARQVSDAVWAGRATAFDDVLTLPAGLRSDLTEAMRFDTVGDTEIKVTDAGQTEKALHRLSDGALVELVLMHYPARGASRERHTLCISSQAGCAVGCPFCATGELGFTRDLETAEIVDQVRHAARRLDADGKRLTNIVFMGMGEPLLNLDRVLASVEALNDPKRFGLGARHITVSTSGVVPGIRRLTALGPQFTLAVSLHAARDPLRDVLVPLNRRWPVAEVVAAAREHAAATGRRISYEVTMIGGVNDTELDAEAMADPAARRPRPRQPHPDEPGRPHAVAGQRDAGHRCLRRHPPRGRHRDDHPPQPRPGDRRGLRPARGGTGRRAVGPGGRPSPGSSRDRQRGRVAGRAQR